MVCSVEINAHIVMHIYTGRSCVHHATGVMRETVLANNGWFYVMEINLILDLLVDFATRFVVSGTSGFLVT